MGVGVLIALLLLHFITSQMKYSGFAAVWLLDKPQLKLGTIYQTMHKSTKNYLLTPNSLTLLGDRVVEIIYMITDNETGGSI